MILDHATVAESCCPVSALKLRREIPQFHATLRCPGAASLLTQPELIGKIRGALGNVLMESASPQVQAGGACPFEPPCAYDLLWQPRGNIRPGFPIPAPYVIAVDSHGPDLQVTLRLFGKAGDYLGEVSDALIRALRRGLSGPKTIKLEVADRQFEAVTGVADPALTHAVQLRFLTPLLLRHDSAAHIEPGAFLRSLIHRVDGMARWCNTSLDLDFPALLEATKAVEGVWTEVDTQEWLRHALRQGRKIPMQGAVGTLSLRGDLAPFSDLIALGTVIHAGSRTAWGQGRYVIGRESRR